MVVTQNDGTAVRARIAIALPTSQGNNERLFEVQARGYLRHRRVLAWHQR